MREERAERRMINHANEKQDALDEVTQLQEALLQKALTERDRFLESHPHLRSYQEEIDRLLDQSGNTQGRLAVLGMLMQGKLLEMHANSRLELKESYAGDIVAIVGLKNVNTGDTICDTRHPIRYESITFPEPVLSIAIEPKTKADQEKLGRSLGRLTEEDPTFKVDIDPETGQTIISGMGELHLEIIVDRLMREFGVDANVGKPQVSYRETITRDTQVEGKYIRQSGGRGQYGHVVVRFEPNDYGKGYEFEDKTKGGVIPREYIKSIEEGIEEAMSTGEVAGYPVVDVKCHRCLV